MFLRPLISITFEIVLNLLYQDRFMSAARQRLKGKVLRFEFAEYNIPIILVFNARQVYVFNVWKTPADCTVRIRLAALPILVECQHLTQMIQQGNIDVEGDLHLLQQFAALLDMAKFDAVELLAPWIGDIVAESFTRFLRRLLHDTLQIFRIWQGLVTQAIIDEWRLAPSAKELAWFCSEVDAVTQASNNLADRIVKLETCR